MKLREIRRQHYAAYRFAEFVARVDFQRFTTPQLRKLRRRARQVITMQPYQRAAIAALMGNVTGAGMKCAVEKSFRQL